MIPFLFVLGVFALGSVNEAEAQGPDQPLQFKMTGKFYEPQKHKSVGGVHSYTVNVLQKQWVFDIESSQTLQGSALGSSVLRQIYPPIMTFMGPKEFTDQLTDPAIEGKTYSLTGQLYLKKRMFRIITLEGPPEEGKEGAAPSSDAEAPQL
jgi:hypothetical protein